MDLLSWQPLRPSWIFNRNDVSYFFICKSPRYCDQVNWPFGSGEEVKLDFQYSRRLGFPAGMILASFALLVAQIFLPSFENWPGV